MSRGSPSSGLTEFPLPGQNLSLRGAENLLTEMPTSAIAWDPCPLPKELHPDSPHLSVHPSIHHSVLLLSSARVLRLGSFHLQTDRHPLRGLPPPPPVQQQEQESPEALPTGRGRDRWLSLTDRTDPRSQLRGACQSDRTVKADQGLAGLPRPPPPPRRQAQSISLLSISAV